MIPDLEYPEWLDDLLDKLEENSSARYEVNALTPYQKGYEITNIYGRSVELFVFENYENTKKEYYHRLGDEMASCFLDRDDWFNIAEPLLSFTTLGKNTLYCLAHNKPSIISASFKNQLLFLERNSFEKMYKLVNIPEIDWVNVAKQYDPHPNLSDIAGYSQLYEQYKPYIVYSKGYRTFVYYGTTEITG